MRIAGHQNFTNGCGSKPKCERRKTTPRTIRIYAPIPDLHFIVPPHALHVLYAGQHHPQFHMTILQKRFVLQNNRAMKRRIRR